MFRCRSFFHSIHSTWHITTSCTANLYMYDSYHCCSTAVYGRTTTTVNIYVNTSPSLSALTNPTTTLPCHNINNDNDNANDDNIIINNDNNDTDNDFSRTPPSLCSCFRRGRADWESTSRLLTRSSFTTQTGTHRQDFVAWFQGRAYRYTQVPGYQNLIVLVIRGCVPGYPQI